MVFRALDRLSSRKFALVLVLPSLIFLVGVIVYPLITLVINSLSKYDQYLVPNFVGLLNFQEISKDPLFWSDLGRSFLYTGSSVILFFIIGFALALSLHKVNKFQTLLRGLCLLPWAIPPVTATMMWRWALNSQYGIINDLLMRTGLIADPVNWLTKGTTAMLVIIFVDAWIRIPFVALILLAGLKSIPYELYESATMDGAGPIKQFHYITLPNIKYPISIVLALQTMFAFRTYDVLSVMTDGGPGKSTELIVKYVHDTAFKGFSFGTASSVSIIMLIICFLFVIFYWKILKLEV